MPAASPRPRTPASRSPSISAALKAAIPAPYRDPANHWFGLTMRSRVVYASKERVKQDAITYEELADPKWKGKICIRSGQHVYNTSLIATIIAHKGEAAAEAWLEGRQGQPGAQARRRRPRAGARHPFRASATSRSATPTTWR